MVLPAMKFNWGFTAHYSLGIPITLAAAIRGRNRSKNSVQVWYDNEAAVNIINQNITKASYLLRYLAFKREKYNFFLFATHIKGKNNDLADALSHKKYIKFHSSYPQAQLLPSAIPEPLLDLLIVQKLDLLATSMQRVYGSAKHCYMQFCLTHHLNPLPTTERCLCRLVSALGLKGLSYSMVKGYLLGIRHLNIEHHLPDPRISA